MVKQRMTALDVRASVEEMQMELRGLRLLNIYDISPKMFIFKFGHGENKKTLLLESGVRMHLTNLVREKPKVPSQFTMKLRKHVRAWRLDSVTQLHHDRSVDFRFGADENASYHIIVELFAKGNVVLTDHEYRILVLLRTHKDNDIKLSVRELYPVTGSFEEHYQRQQEELKSRPLEEQRLWCIDALRSEWHRVFARHAEYETTRSTLSAVHHFGPTLADHILTVAGVKNTKKCDMTCDAETMFTQLLPGMLEAWSIAFSALPSGGYLIHKKKQAKNFKVGQNTSSKKSEESHTRENDGENKTVDVVTGLALPIQAVQYDDFSPVLLAQYNADDVVTSFMPSFGSVCDAFFLHTEAEKIEQHNEKNVISALSKKEKFEREHERRLRALEKEEQVNQRKGECIIENAEKIDEAIGLINGALAAGIQWDALRSLLKRRHAEGHPVAYMVHELFLERNSISVLVEAPEEEGGNKDEDCKLKPYVIEVDLGKTAYANAATYFGKMKANRVKHEKTVASTAKAMAGAEKKGERVAARLKNKKVIVKERRRFWWEKFLWFRTSSGDYVLQGRDAQTTEILVRRVMRLGDVFVHCDVDGAFPCILRPVGSASCAAIARESCEIQQIYACTLPVISLEEAGAWCVSCSSAWQSKFSVGAWWVHASQITGGTATGCYLFEGEKHYLSPRPLSLACGLLFRVSSRTICLNDLEELPNVISESDRSQLVKNSYENGAFILPDSASTLHLLPPVNNVRGLCGRKDQRNLLEQEKQQQQKSHVSVKKITNRNNSFCKDEVTLKAKSEKITKTDFGQKQSGDHTERAHLVSKAPQQLTKYQRRKLKKIQEKYKDQDDDDRFYGAFLNGNQLSKVQQELLKNNGEKHQQTYVSTSLEKSKTYTSDDSEEKRDEDVLQVDHEDMAENNHPSSVLTNITLDEKELKSDQHDETTTLQTQRPAAMVSVEETRATNNAVLQSEWQNYTSRPLPTDKIDYAVAICAPMSSVISYKYRVELSCGTDKKGQVAASLQSHFAALAHDGENQSEVQAVMSLQPNDLMEQLRGNLKRLNSKKRV